jgi:hypothetical protein
MRTGTPLAVAAALSLACAHGASSKERHTAEIHHDLGVEALRNGRPHDAIREFDAAVAAKVFLLNEPIRYTHFQQGELHQMF